MRAAAYVRVSSDPQLEKFGPDSQRHAIEAYARARGITLCKFYEDSISGTLESREALDRLLRDAGAYEAVIVSDVDRLARRVALSYRLLDELEKAGLSIHVASLGNAVDLNEMGSSLTFGMHAVLAEMQHRQLLHRLVEGKRAKVRQGKPMRSLYAFGYKDGQPDPVEAEIIQKIFSWSSSGVGTQQMQSKLFDMGVASPTGKPMWDRSTLLKVVRSPLYRGEYQFGRDRAGRPPKTRELITCPVPAIVSDEVWYYANEQAKARKKGQGRAGARGQFYSLTGRVFCAHCGRAMVGGVSVYTRKDQSRNEYLYYTCGDRTSKPTKRKDCPHTRTYRVNLVHDAVRAELGQLLNQPQLLTAALITPARPVPNIEGPRKALEEKLVRANRALVNGLFTDQEYLIQKRELERQLGALELLGQPEPAPPPSVAAIADHLQAVLAGAELNQIARALGLHVRMEQVARGEELHIHLRLNPLPQ